MITFERELFSKVMTENDYKTDYYDKNYTGVILTIQLRRKLSYHLVLPKPQIFPPKWEENLSKLSVHIFLTQARLRLPEKFTQKRAQARDKNWCLILTQKRLLRKVVN